MAIQYMLHQNEIIHVSETDIHCFSFMNTLEEDA